MALVKNDLNFTNLHNFYITLLLCQVDGKIKRLVKDVDFRLTLSMLQEFESDAKIIQVNLINFML